MSLDRILSGQEEVVKLLQATERLMLARLLTDIPRKLVAGTDQRLVQYLQARIGSRSTETMRILFLDGANRLMGDEEFGDGSPRRILVQPRSIVKRALELDASGIILAHNHPGGNPEPSRKDVQFTQSLKSACQQLDIRLQDHIIISGNRWASLRKLGLL
ncbi:JAB domain-containing protein [Parasphingorhabdus sp.]|uniref:JAB domain-containing protein n=1 Tax=Parasphingorhabdus sp. TaxID=2709688 RepID=UPI0030014927